MHRDLLEDRGSRTLRRPVPEALRRGAVEHEPRHVKGSICGVGGNGVTAEALLAPCRQTAKRRRAFTAAAHVECDRRAGRRWRGDLALHERGQVGWMQAV